MDTTKADTAQLKIGSRIRYTLNLHALLFEFKRPQPIENVFSLPEGSPGHVPLGMADSDSIKQIAVNRKREKQRRHRNNKKARKDKKPERNKFYVKNKERTTIRRRYLRRSWREFKSAMLSERAQRVSNKLIKKHKPKNNRDFLSSRYVKNKIKWETHEWFRANYHQMRNKFNQIRSNTDKWDNREWTQNNN